MSPKKTNQKPEITENQKESAEAEIREKQKYVDYDTKEYPVEVLVQKYMEGKDDDTNELFIPDYQREIAWDEKKQSKFIESVLLGLPIPFIFVGDIYDPVANKSRLEIIDGTQRIRTLANFINNELTLEGLDKLPNLNHFTFTDLIFSRQRRFKRTTIRIVELTKKAYEEVRQYLFETRHIDFFILKENMEKRREMQHGAFLNLIDELSENSKFQKLCPFSDTLKKRGEPQEFILRFFAYLNNYKNFKSQVNQFLDDYLEEQNSQINLDRAKMKAEFELMLDFVEKYFPHGFKKGEKHSTTSRIRFEAISVGVALALRKRKSLKPKSMDWLDSAEFKEYTTSDASNSRPKLIRRIEYVRDQLLAK